MSSNFQKFPAYSSPLRPIPTCSSHSQTFSSYFKQLPAMSNISSYFSLIYTSFSLFRHISAFLTYSSPFHIHPISAECYIFQPIPDFFSLSSLFPHSIAYFTQFQPIQENGRKMSDEVRRASCNGSCKGFRKTYDTNGEFL